MSASWWSWNIIAPRVPLWHSYCLRYESQADQRASMFRAYLSSHCSFLLCLFSLTPLCSVWRLPWQNKCVIGTHGHLIHWIQLNVLFIHYRERRHLPLYSRPYVTLQRVAIMPAWGNQSVVACQMMDFSVTWINTQRVAHLTRIQQGIDAELIRTPLNRFYTIIFRGHLQACVLIAEPVCVMCVCVRVCVCFVKSVVVY